MTKRGENHRNATDVPSSCLLETGGKMENKKKPTISREVEVKGQVPFARSWD